MALSQEQKKQLSLLIELPEEFLNKCKEQKIYLKGFRNQFFKDGVGIFHLIAEGLFTEKRTSYEKILDYIFEEEKTLDIFQASGHKPNGFNIFLDKLRADYQPDLSHILKKIIINSSKEKNNYLIQNAICFLAEKKDNFNLLSCLQDCPQVFEEKSLISKLLKEIIKNNNVELLNSFLKNKNIYNSLTENIGSWKYSIDSNYQKNNNSNIISYCIANNSLEVLKILLANFNNQEKINFEGKPIAIKNDYFNSGEKQASLHPLDIALQKDNLEIFQYYFNFLSQEKRIIWLCEKVEHGINRISGLYKKGWGDIIESQLNNYLSDDSISNKLKINLTKQLLYLKTENDETDYEYINKILKPLWPHVPKPTDSNEFLSRFFFNGMHIDKPLEEKDINAIVEIFCHLKERHHFANCERLFSNVFFNEPVLVRKLLEVGLDLNNIPSENEKDKKIELNIFEKYIELCNRNHNNKYSSYKYDMLHIDKCKETLSLLYLYDKDLIFKPTKNNETLLEQTIQYANMEVFNLFSLDDLKKFKSISSTCGVNYLYMDNLTRTNEEYEYIVKSIHEAGFDFKLPIGKYIKAPAFVHIINNLYNTPLLEKIIDEQGIDINAYSKEYDFWKCLSNLKNINYLKNNLIEKPNENLLKSFLSTDYHNDNLNLMLNLFDETPYFQQGKENILHYSIKTENYKSAKLILKLFPSLAVEANEQHKLPISYLIYNLSRVIEKNEKSSKNSSKLENLKELFDLLIEAGVNSKDKKSNKFLEEQIKKYPIIGETFPELIKKMEYKKLLETLPSKEKVSNYKKSKI